MQHMSPTEACKLKAQVTSSRGNDNVREGWLRCTEDRMKSPGAKFGDDGRHVAINASRC